MAGILGSLGFGGGTPRSNSNNIRGASNNRGSSGGWFGFGSSRKDPSFEEMKKQPLKDFRYKSVIDKDKRFSDTNITKIYGRDKVYKIKQGKEKFSVRNAGELLKEDFTKIGSSRTKPDIEDAVMYLVEKKGFLRKDAKEFISKFGKTIYKAPETGPTREVIARRIASMKAMEGIGSNFGSDLALNRKGKNSLKSFQDETSVRLGTMDTGNKVHGISALSQQKINTDDIRRAGGIKYIEKGKVSIIDTGKAAGVVQGNKDARGISGQIKSVPSSKGL